MARRKAAKTMLLTIYRERARRWHNRVLRLVAQRNEAREGAYFHETRIRHLETALCDSILSQRNTSELFSSAIDGKNQIISEYEAREESLDGAKRLLRGAARMIHSQCRGHEADVLIQEIESVAGDRNIQP